MTGTAAAAVAWLLPWRTIRRQRETIGLLIGTIVALTPPAEEPDRLRLVR